MSKPYVRLNKDDVAVLLVDHQTGLLSLVRDIDPDKFKNNVLALADIARYFQLIFQAFIFTGMVIKPHSTTRHIWHVSQNIIRAYFNNAVLQIFWMSKFIIGNYTLFFQQYRTCKSIKV